MNENNNSESNIADDTTVPETNETTGEGTAVAKNDLSDQDNDNGEKTDTKEEIKVEENGEKPSKIAGKRSPMHLVIDIVLLVVIVILAVQVGNIASQRNSLNDQLVEASSNLESLSGDNDDLTNQNKDLGDQITDLGQQITDLTNEKEKLQQQYDDDEKKITELNDKINELENGAAKQLVEIKNSYEAKEWQDVVDKAAALHKEYNGSDEDKQAQELSKKAQQKIDEAAKAAAEKEAKGYDTGITYSQLARTPDDYIGEKCKFSGKVLQVIEGDDEIDLRIAVNGNYDDVIYCGYDPSITKKRVLEDDQVTVYGISTGTISYQSTFGGQITIPGMLVEKIEIK